MRGRNTGGRKILTLVNLHCQFPLLPLDLGWKVTQVTFNPQPTPDTECLAYKTTQLISETRTMSESDSTKGSSRLKQLTQSSTWTSPFRTGKKKNIVQEFKDSNNVSKVTVPKKFTSHPTLEAEKKKAVATEADTSAAEPNEAENAAVDGTTEAAPETEAIESTTNEQDAVVVDKEIEEVTDKIHAALVASPESVGPTDDNIEQQVEETPIELNVDDSAKFEPVKMPNQAVLDSLQDNPNLLNRYQELNAAAIGSASKSLDDPNKIIDLGSGLKLTQQQLLDIAAKRVAPLIANINEEVAKSREEDRIVNQHELDAKVVKHQGKLKAAFEKHVAKCEKQKTKITKDIEMKLKQVADNTTAAVAAHESYKTQNAKDIETANSDYEERERLALEKHETDKETLLKNHDELEATKKQELQTCKDDQVTTAQEIEDYKEKHINVGAHNEELDKELAELAEQLEQREKELQELQDKLYAERIAVDRHEQTKKELNEKLDAANAEVETKKSHKGKLALEVGALATAVAAYSAHLANLKTEKSNVPSKVDAAKKRYDSWVQEKKDLALQVAREHEQQRLEAKEAAATEQYKTQLEEEKRQLEEERQRHLEEKEQFELEEKQRLAEDKRRRDEEEAKALENEKLKQQEEEAAKKLAAEKQALADEAAESERHQKQVEEESARAKKAASAAAVAGTAASVGTVNIPTHLNEGNLNRGNSSASSELYTKPVSKGTAEPSGKSVEDSQNKIDSKLGAFAVGAGAGAIIAGGAAAALPAFSGSDESKHKSLKKKFKNMMGMGKDEGASTKVVPVVAKEEPFKVLDESKAVAPKETDQDVYSLYEEVSDDEFARNQDNPDYLEVDTVLADKLLKKNRD